MGNCLQSQQSPSDGIERAMSLQSQSSIHTDKMAAAEADQDKSSTATPSVSHVAPLPVNNIQNTILEQFKTASIASMTYNTPTVTHTVPSNSIPSSNTSLDTPNTLFGTTPSSNIPSSISHSIPPLLTLNSTHSLQTILDPTLCNSNSEPTPLQTPQQTPDIDQQHMKCLHIDQHDEHVSYKTKQTTRNIKSIFSLKRLKKKKNAKFSKTPTIKPIASPSHGIRHRIMRKRGQTFDAPSAINDLHSSTDEKHSSTNHRLKKRAKTFGILSYKNKKKKAKHKRNIRSRSIHSNAPYTHDGLHKKLKYKRNTSIQVLESYTMEGNVKGVISVLRKYETLYPPFFMEYSNELGHTLLMKAAFLGHFGLMKYIIQRYKEYKYAVIDSIEPDHGRDIASLCLEFMGDYINYESSGGKSALIFACSCKHRCRLNIVKYLLESGASVAAPRHSKHGKSPLIYAVEWKQQDLMELLLDYGADINVKDSNNGFTPLMYAAKFNNRDLCDFLLARNADKTLANTNGKTAVELAVTDHCWGSLLALDVTQIPSNVLSIAAASPSKNRWGRYSLSYQFCD